MELTFQESPTVTIATNTFINVPVILQYEDEPLIEIVGGQEIGFMTRIPIYHSDGTHLAMVTGNRVFSTREGREANIQIRDLYGKFICSLDNKVIFELTHGVGDAFTASAELYTPDGCFVKCTDAPGLELFDLVGDAIQVGGITVTNSTFQNHAIGILLRKDGSCAIGVS